MPFPTGWLNPSYLVCVACLANLHHECAGNSEPGACACLCQADNRRRVEDDQDDDEGS